MALNSTSHIADRVSRSNFGRVGILLGGPSTEREISLKSGKAVLEALQEEGEEVVFLDIKTNNEFRNIKLLKEANIDIAFIALHGRFGEDGGIQKILEDLNIPYTGSGVMASRLAMDKVASRRIFQIHGLTVPRYKVIHRLSYHRNSFFDNNFSFPLVIKPATHGSSLGLSIIDTKREFKNAVELAFNFDEFIIIEEYIEGKEVTVGIINDAALPVIEIKPKRRFFDYQAKYMSGLTDYIVPANLKKYLSQILRQNALLAHRFLGCEGFSRVDMILKSATPYILEINTIPGLTETSLLPKAAKAAGIAFNQLCLYLLKLAYEKKEIKNTV